VTVRAVVLSHNSLIAGTSAGELALSAQNPTLDSRKDLLETGHRHFDVPFTGVAESIDIGPPILNDRERPAAIDSPFHHLPSVTGSSKA
jgi:hypothetical protein